jgi:hypothetical protein
MIPDDVYSCREEIFDIWFSYLGFLALNSLALVFLFSYGGLISKIQHRAKKKKKKKKKKSTIS